MAEKLNKIWAKSKPLKHYFEELVAAIRDRKSQQLIEQIEQLEAPENSTNFNRTLSTAARSMAVSNAEREYKNEAHDQLRNASIAEEIRLIGIADQDNSIVEIPPVYWIGADISPELNQATSDGRSFRDLRVLDVLYSPSMEVASTIGPKSYKARRLEVISACIHEKLVDFQNDNLEKRFAAYLFWISRNRTDWDIKRVFGIKAFESNEKEVKVLKNIP